MKPRIMMILHQFNPRPNNVGLQAERLGGKLVGLNHSVQALTRRTDLYSLPRETIRGITVHRRDFPLAVEVTAVGSSLFRFLVRQRKTYDILHSHQAFGHAVVAALVGIWLRKKTVLKISCSGDYGDLNLFKSMSGFESGLRILRKTDAVIAVSSAIERELVTYGFPPEKIRRIPNGVDIHHFHRRRPLPDNKKIRFVFAGRRTPRKGVDTAIEAVKILVEQGFGDRMELYLFGDSIPDHDYEKMSREMGLEKQVIFHSTHAHMTEVYDDANALLLPSRAEGLSNALLEAMAYELPIIATRVSGSADLIEHDQNGLLIEPDSPTDLADAMKVVITDRRRVERMGLAARDRVKGECSLNTIAGRYAALYEELRNDR